MTSKDAFLSVHSDLAAHVRWVEDDGVDLSAFLDEVVGELASQKRHLPLPTMRVFQRTVVLNRFFERWLRRYQVQGWRTVAKDNREDYDLFVTAVLLVVTNPSTHRTVLRQTKRLLPRGAPAGVLHPNRKEEYIAFATESAEGIARRFIKHFDLNRPQAMRTAVRYIQRSTVGLFAADATARIADDPSSILHYVNTSTRVSPRLRIASILAYAPHALTKKDLEYLTTAHDWKPVYGRSYRKQEIARRLGFASRDVLYTALYKLRKRARSKRPTGETAPASVFGPCVRKES